jgi:hypothetical protein
LATGSNVLSSNFHNLMKWVIRKYYLRNHLKYTFRDSNKRWNGKNRLGSYSGIWYRIQQELTSLDLINWANALLQIVILKSLRFLQILVRIRANCLLSSVTSAT